MATIALRQRKRYGAMTNTAVLTVQYFRHANRITVQYRSKQCFVTHLAGHPFVMRLVREQHIRLIQRILHDDIRIVLPPSCFTLQARPWLDLSLPKCFGPIDLITSCIRREHRQSLFRILQYTDSGVRRVV